MMNADQIRAEIQKLEMEINEHKDTVTDETSDEDAFEVEELIAERETKIDHLLSCLAQVED